MRKVSPSIAVAAVVASFAAANACFQPDLLTGPGGTGAGTVTTSSNACVCPDEPNPCTDDMCVSGMCVHEPAVGRECVENGGIVCDDQGECVACLPGGIDCAGNCPRCDGATCTTSGTCLNGNCVDGVCCAAPCDGTCFACNIPGNLGTCTQVSVGTVDDTCGASQACNNNGQCVDLGNTQPLGGPCMQDSQCLNTTCSGGICRLKLGEPCNDSVQCGTNLCKDSACTQCASPSECVSNACSGGICTAAVGQLCDTSSIPCATGASCTTIGVCRLNNGQSCTNDLECTSNLCSTQTCTACNMQNACNGSVMCLLVVGACDIGLPSGSYCISDNTCQSMNCVGFPPRCQ